MKDREHVTVIMPADTTIIKRFTDHVFVPFGKQKIIIARKIEEDDWDRAGGECICKVCNWPFDRHKNLYNYEWLTVLCDLRLVKL